MCQHINKVLPFLQGVYMDLNESVVYNNGEIELKVSIENETIWASIQDIASIFDIDRSVISRHIKNIFKDRELDEKVVCANFAHTTKHGALSNKTQTREVKYYNLDIILAVGYRTNSAKAIKFRQWASKVLKEYIYNGFAINREKITQQRLLNLEKDVAFIKSRIKDNTLEYRQGIFFDGQIFDAYVFVNDLIKSAKKSIVLIDNYIDETTLILFAKVPEIEVTIYTHTITKQLKLDYQKYNAQYNNITLQTFKKSHDRFLIIDGTEVYHIGASLKDLGRKWFAFSKMDRESVRVLAKI